MIKANQIERERPPEWLVCPGSFAKASMICNEPTCNAYPVMCADEECPCQEPHRKHLQLRIRGFLDKINEPPVFSEELRKAEKAMNGLIDNMASIIDRLRQKHQKLMEEYVMRHDRFAQLRHMLRNRQQPEAKYMAGGNMAKMLAEMENIKQMKSPYTTGAEGVER
jgi:predicted RNase H-like nuclease (RuvC/YqgF family)